MSAPGSPRSIHRRDVPDALFEAFPGHLHPVLRRVYASRQVASGELEPSLARMIPVGELKGAWPAAERLAECLRRQERVLVVGDFDADGATATALCVSTMRAMGFENVSFLVPDRFECGYGLSPKIVDIAAKFEPQLIVTVDNGVSSIDGVRHAQEKGIEVLVTDHHLPGAEIPAADFMVNPNVPGEPFPSKSLCGVGVIFYVMAALGRILAERGLLDEAQGRSIVAGGLDLVALGTVADLVPLDYNNRILVAEGLRRIRANRTRPGIRALFSIAAREFTDARSSDLGFRIAPRLNAAGRLTDMRLGIECLLADSDAQAGELAKQLDELNHQRRALQATMESDAGLHLDETIKRLGDTTANAFCLFDHRWHEGVVGLVATRMKDQARRPVIAFARSKQAGLLKGSARSIPGIHIRDVLDSVASRHPDIIHKFGGHAMAAGLTLHGDDLDAFRRAFDTEVGGFQEVLERPDVILTDGSLSAEEMRMDLAEALTEGGPWGQGFPEPVFDNLMEIVDHRVLKERHLKLKVRHPDHDRIVDAIAFNQSELPVAGRGSSIRLVYRLEVNEFRNRRQSQLVVEHMQSD